VISPGGYDGALRLWDFRDPFEPLLDLIPPRRHVITDLCWMEGLCFWVANDDGALLLSDVRCSHSSGQQEKLQARQRFQDTSPLLSCHITPGRFGFEWVAFGGLFGQTRMLLRWHDASISAMNDLPVLSFHLLLTSLQSHYQKQQVNLGTFIYCLHMPEARASPQFLRVLNKYRIQNSNVMALHSRRESALQRYSQTPFRQSFQIRRLRL